MNCELSGPSPCASKLVPPPLDADAAAVAAWLADNVHIVGHDRGTLQSNTKPIVLSANSVRFPWRADPARNLYGFRQLELWTNLWADSRLAVELLPGVGLGLVAKAPIREGEAIVGGVVDYDIVDYKSLTLVSCRKRMGALLGPASLANSMCERHANAITRHDMSCMLHRQTPSCMSDLRNSSRASSSRRRRRFRACRAP